MKKFLLIVLIFIIFTLNLNAKKIKILFPKEIKATSYLLENEEAVFHPVNLYDQEIKTVYSESTKGPGIGTIISFDFNNEVSIKKLHVVNGFQKHESGYKNNNRIKSIEVLGFLNGDEVSRQNIDIKDIKDQQNFKLNIIVDKIDVKIIDVYKGSKYDDTCISELNFSGTSSEKV